MKLMRFVLFLTLLLTLSVSPAQAKAKAQEYSGFVRLLIQIKPNIPLQVQTQQAFDELLPQLLAARQNGTILEFEPDFQAGIVKIRYAGTNRMTFDKTQVFDDIRSAAALVLAQQTTDTQPENSVPHFSFELYSSCFHASGLPSNVKVLGNMRDQTGRIVSNYAGTTSAVNTLADCFIDWAGSYSDVLPGYKLTFNVYTDLTGTALFGSYVITVPSMSFTGIDNANSMAQGTAPAGKAYLVSWWHPNLDAGNTLSFLAQYGTVSAGRTWNIHFDGNVPFRGGDQLLLVVTQNTNFEFVHRLTLPYSFCQLGSNTCYLQGFPFQNRSMTITHAGIPYTFTGKADGTGFFGVQLIDKKGYPVFLVKGDKISGTGIQPYALPNLTASPHFDTDVVSGNVPADKYFYLSVRDDYDQTWYLEWAHSKPTVNFYAVNYYASQKFDLKPSDALTFRIEYTDPVNGNQTKMLSSVGP